MQPWLFWTLIAIFVGLMGTGANWAWADHKTIGVYVLIAAALGLIETLCYQFFPKAKHVRCAGLWYGMRT
jgi:hypothetical protein